MNFLLIIADQLSARALEDPSFAKHGPNLRRLVAQSRTFSRAYCPYPLCGPSRAAFWTGCSPQATGVLSNEPGGDPAERGRSLPTLGKTFSAAGYQCVHVGKFHDHGTLAGFECHPLREGLEPGATPFPLHYDSLQDIETCRLAEQQLATLSSDKIPWMLAIDFNNPHDICNWVGWHAEHRSPTAEPPLPNPMREECPELWETLVAAHGRQEQSKDWGTSDWQQYRAAYAYYLSRLDGHVGRVLAALEARSDADDTTIVFWSDHGDSLGRNGFATKHAFFIDEVIRVPLTFRIPGLSPKQCAVPVSLIDIFPTLSELAGLPVAGDIEGISLASCLTGNTPCPDRPIDCVWEEPAPRDQLHGHCTIRHDRVRVEYPSFRYTENIPVADCPKASSDLQ